MRKMILLFVASLALAACVPPEGGLTEDDVAGFWELVDGNVGAAKFPFAPSHRVTLRLDIGGNLGGTAACNSYFGTYDVVASIFALGAEIRATAMACEADVALAESSFFEALRLVDSVALTEEGELHLVGEEADLLFDPLAEVDLDALVGRWSIVGLGDADGVSPPEGDPFIEFTADGTMTGSTGCRPVMGNFITNGDEVQMTAMEAPGECSGGLVDQDALITAVLGATFVPEASDDRLVLVASGGASLELDRS